MVYDQSYIGNLYQMQLFTYTFLKIKFPILSTSYNPRPSKDIVSIQHKLYAIKNTVYFSNT